MSLESAQALALPTTNGICRLYKRSSGAKPNWIHPYLKSTWGAGGEWKTRSAKLMLTPACFVDFRCILSLYSGYTAVWLRQLHSAKRILSVDEGIIASTVVETQVKATPAPWSLQYSAKTFYYLRMDMRIRTQEKNHARSSIQQSHFLTLYTTSGR